MKNLTDEQRAICNQMGISPDDLQAASLEEIKDAAAKNVLSPEEYDICKRMGTDPLDYIVEKAKSKE